MCYVYAGKCNYSLMNGVFSILKPAFLPILSGWFLLLPIFLFSQEVILFDQGGGILPYNHNKGNRVYKTASQEVDTLTLPFFDDFSSDSLIPDCQRWFIDHPHLPFITSMQAVNIPTKG